MYKMAEALGRLALAGRDMTRLSGFTTRVDSLMNVLDDIDKGSYKRTMVTDTNLHVTNGEGSKEKALEKMDIKPGAGVKEFLFFSNSLKNMVSGQLIIEDNIIRFENVPLVTPNGDVLVKSLNLEVNQRFFSSSSFSIAGCFRNQCSRLRTKRVWKEFPLPRPWGTLAPVRWKAHQAR